MKLFVLTARVEHLQASCCFLPCKMDGFLQEETNRLEAPKQATLKDQFISVLSRSDLFESKWQGQREGGSMICDNNTATGPSPSDASAIDLLGHTTALCWIYRDCPFSSGSKY